MSYSTKITNINSSKIQTIDLLENIDFEYLECIASERLSPSTGTAEWSWKSCIINGICFNTKYSAASFNNFISATVSAD